MMVPHALPPVTLLCRHMHFNCYRDIGSNAEVSEIPDVSVHCTALSLGKLEHRPTLSIYRIRSIRRQSTSANINVDMLTTFLPC